MSDRPDVKDRTETADDRAVRGEMWPEYEQYHQRFHQVEMEFMEEPRAAVQKADQLVHEAMDHMTSSWRDRLQQMHGQVESESDTERLRLAMLGYKHFMEAMGGRRAA